LALSTGLTTAKKFHNPDAARGKVIPIRHGPTFTSQANIASNKVSYFILLPDAGQSLDSLPRGVRWPCLDFAKAVLNLYVGFAAADPQDEDSRYHFYLGARNISMIHYSCNLFLISR
jgi:hypothetical protein